MRFFTPIVLALVVAGAAAADDSCTLKKPIKVRIGGAFQLVAAGTNVTVKTRRADWTDVTVPAGEGKAATVPLEANCALPPRPAEPALEPLAPTKPEPKKPEPKKPEPKKPPEAKKPPPPPPVVDKPPPVKPAPPEKTPEKTPAKPPEKPAKPEKPTPLPAGALGFDHVPEPSLVEPATTPLPTPTTTGPAPAFPTTTTPTTTTLAPTPTLSAAPASESRVLRVAVPAVRTGDVATQQGRLGVLFTRALGDEVQKHQRASVVDSVQVEGLLDPETEARLQACKDDGCVAAVAAALGADVWLQATIADDSSGRVVTLRRTNRDGKVLLAEQRLIKDDGDAALALIGPAVDQLFTDLPLKEGEQSGASDAVTAALHPPPLDPWMPLAIGGVAAACAVVAVGAGAVNIAAYNEGSTLATSGSLQKPVDGDALLAQQNAVRGTFPIVVGAGIAAVVVGAGAGVAAVFTDWAGVRDLTPDE